MRTTTKKGVPGLTALVFALMLGLGISSTLFIGSATAAPTMKVLELSKEGALVSFNVNKNGMGRASVKLCEECENLLSLNISPETELFLFEARASFAEIRRLRNKRATVFYLPGNSSLTRLIIQEPLE